MTDPLSPKPGYSSLRRHRWSAPGADYFVTFKAQRPTAKLAEPHLIAALNRHREKLESAHHWTVRTWVIMPDHFHIVLTLGESIALSDCLRRFKGPLTPVLRRAGLRWQPGYYEHRMRAGEDRLPVFLYVFLNPYRARLLPSDQKWSGYFCSAEDWLWFGPLTNSDTPFPEWLA